VGRREAQTVSVVNHERVGQCSGGSVGPRGRCSGGIMLSGRSPVGGSGPGLDGDLRKDGANGWWSLRPAKRVVGKPVPRGLLLRE